MSPPWRNHLLHDEAARARHRFRAQTVSKIVHDLIAQTLTSGAPALCAGELFDAAPKSPKPDDLRRMTKLLMQLVAQPWKKGELEALAAFTRQTPEVVPNPTDLGFGILGLGNR